MFEAVGELDPIDEHRLQSLVLFLPVVYLIGRLYLIGMTRCTFRFERRNV